MTPVRKLAFLAVGCLAALPVAAADGAVLLGYVFDPTVAGIRPVQGVPGAARLGDALALPDFFWGASVAPGQNYALAVADSGVALVRFAGDAAASEAPLGTGTPLPDVLAFNASGTAAAFYNRAKASVSVIAGLPDAPAVAFTLDVSVLPAPLLSLALSDDAGAVLAGCSDGANGGVYRFDSSGAAQAVFSTPHPAAVLFRKSDAVVADDQTNTVTIVRDPAGAAQSAALAAPSDGVAGPLALSLTDTGLVLAALGGGVLVLDPDGGEPPVNVACPCQVTGLDHLADRAAFRLTGASTGPMWLLDLAGDAPRAVFVPPAAAPDGQ